jgi:hypothetical protein
MFSMMPYAEQPRNATAVNVLRSWLTAIGVTHKPSKVRGCDICVDRRDGGVLEVQVVMGEEEKNLEGAVRVRAHEITGKASQKKLDAFWRVTDAAGYERKRPVDRGQEPELNEQGNPKKLHYRDDFDLVAFRHTETRWSPDPDDSKWVQYKPTMEKVSWGFLKMNSKLCERVKFDIDDVMQYARMWLINYCARYEVPNPVHFDNERKCYRYLQQRFNNDLRSLLLKKLRSTTPDAETVSIALFGTPDADPEVSPDGAEEEIDQDYIERHCELDTSTPQARRRSATAKLKELLEELPHDQLVDTLQRTAANESLDWTARKEAGRWLNAHEKGCKECSPGTTAAPTTPRTRWEKPKPAGKKPPAPRMPESKDGARIPQANRLDMVRRLVDCVRMGKTDSHELSEACGFSTRQAGYYRHAAEVLGFLDGDGVTRSGSMLLKTTACSDEETAALREGIMNAEALRQVAWFFRDGDRDVSELAAFLMTTFAMAEATAKRRAAGLNCWRRHLG